MEPVYVYAEDGGEVRRAGHVIALHIHDHRRHHPQQHQQHQRFSPHENGQITRYSPAAPAEEYEPTAMTTSQPGTQLGSPASTYSPPVDGIRGTQHQLVATGYAETGNGTIKYEAVAAVTTDSIKPNSTYTTLETVALPTSQPVQYTQYVTDGFHHTGSYTYAKPGEIAYHAYPTSQPGSRASEVRNSEL